MIETIHEGSSLLPALAFSGLSVDEMWLDYWALGGSRQVEDLVTYMAGGSAWSAREHDLAALALNEECHSLGFGYPAAYGKDITDH